MSARTEASGSQGAQGPSQEPALVLRRAGPAGSEGQLYLQQGTATVALTFLPGALARPPGPQPENLESSQEPVLLLLPSPVSWSTTECSSEHGSHPAVPVTWEDSSRAAGLQALRPWAPGAEPPQLLAQ